MTSEKAQNISILYIALGEVSLNVYLSNSKTSNH